MRILAEVEFDHTRNVGSGVTAAMAQSEIFLGSSIDLETLRTVLVVAETGSFHGASRQLQIGQSAVSRRVQKLEDQLGVSLFERRYSGARLTSAGSCFAARLRSFLQNLSIAIEEVQHAGVAEAGTLRLGIIASLSRGPLRRALSEFTLQSSEVNIIVVEASRGELLTALSHREIDAVVAAGESAPEYGDHILISRESIFLAVPADHSFAGKQRLSWEEIRQATFIVSAEEPGPEIHDYILRRISDLGRKAHVQRYRLGREGIMSLVGLGFGVSLVADHWLGVAYPNVVFVPVGPTDERVPFSLTWKAENDNPALRRFISLARIEAKKIGVHS